MHLCAPDGRAARRRDGADAILMFGVLMHRHGFSDKPQAHRSRITVAQQIGQTPNQIAADAKFDPRQAVSNLRQDVPEVRPDETSAHRDESHPRLDMP